MSEIGMGLSFTAWGRIKKTTGAKGPGAEASQAFSRQMAKFKAEAKLTHRR